MLSEKQLLALADVDREKDRRIAELEAALDRCMMGGNHIASQLINRYGADFADRYPYTGEGPSENDDVLFCDLWACWANIMKARDAAFAITAA